MIQEVSVSPLHDPLVAISVRGETHPGIAQLAKGTMLIPVVNDGLSAITGGRATLRAGTEQRLAELRTLAPGEIQVLRFGRWDAMPDFELRLEGVGPDGTSFETCARFDADRDRYV